ncbi:EPIDERMAL PATTERNING FACTOR-like protein 2 [Aegilops tauschii subsp. strangulata]|uniref:EPIDERMAL PATTERNING FACTOR-like protein 2 n=1 Tax=Aegilops tauschii subsp. strangulata TaxID=200361 RepID=UPI00098B7734|nr:EPIDERMAL PATTERNING FACTOR-like protein 2 [Aegilops tauschii subsp. strangulata]
MGRRRHVVLLLLLLLLLQLVPRILASTAATHGNGEAAITKDEGGSVGAMMRQTLGSRPPSCEGQCQWACGGRRCEAVQVPVTPRDLEQQLKKKKEKRTSLAAGRGGGVLLPSSYDEHSNYKPLGWRCKCLHS